MLLRSVCMILTLSSELPARESGPPARAQLLSPGWRPVLCQLGRSVPVPVAFAETLREGSEPEAVSRLGRTLRADPPGADRRKLEANLDDARRRLAEMPDDPDRVVWVGRRLGYLWRMNDAIRTFSDGSAAHPDYAPLYRHRGHRYISLRRFDEAIADLEKAAKLIADRPDEIEPDGAPNARNIPLTTLAFNVWYHLGVAHFLKGDFQKADDAFRETLKHTRGLDDNLVAVTDWRYMCLCRMGRRQEASALLDPITPDMDIIENHAYHRRLLIYKGVLAPSDLLDQANASQLDVATMGFGVGHGHLCQGAEDEAVATFKRVVDGPYWPAFGFVAAEVELARLAKAP